MKNVSKLIPLLYIFLVATLFPHFSYAEDGRYTLNKNTFEVKIPAGIYFYKATPDIKQNVFSILWIIENKQIVDPVRILKKSGLGLLQPYLIGNQFNVYSGETLIGNFSMVELLEIDVCGRTGFPSFPIAKGNYQGEMPQSFILHESQWGIGSRIFAASRILASPQNLLLGEGYQQVTEKERAQLVRAIQTALVPSQLKKISSELARTWGAKYKIVGEGESGLVFLEKIDIDSNGEPDFIGTYQLSARYGKTEDSALPGTMLFAALNNREVIQLNFSGGIDGYKLIGVIDINSDGLKEIIYEERVPAKGEGGDPGKRIHVLSYDRAKWREVYRSGATCDGKPYNFVMH